MSLFDDLPRRPRGRGAARRRGRPSAPARRPDATPTDGPPVESVAGLTDRIDAALKGFGRVAVEGEISRPKTVASGHVFFTLKDDRAALDAKIWRSQVPRALGGLKLEDGARVVCHGSLDVYPPYGKHSLIVDRVEARGLGALLAELERLKAQLRDEGLFDRKRPLPRLPRVVGVVTSRDADAWRDFLRTRSLRWSGFPVRLAHSRVQGQTAAREIAGAIEHLDRSGVDVIVVCRGGGAIEDLWCFNDEVVARAAFAASVPVVSGVGHETDTTLIDHVADHRAHTPTDAAQTVIPERRALEDALQRSSAYLGDAVERALERREERLARAGAARSLRDPAALLERRQAQTRELGRRLGGAVAARLERGASALERAGSRLERSGPFARVGRAEERLRALAAGLAGAANRAVERRAEALARAAEDLIEAGDRRARAAEERLSPLARTLAAVSPHAVLERGCSITRKADGSVVGSAGDLSPGERISTLLSSGEVDSEVTDTRPDPGAEERA